MTDAEPVEPWVGRTQTRFQSMFGSFELRAYKFPGGIEHAALFVGSLREATDPLVRVQSSCITGTAFGAVLCDCRAQFEQSLERIVDEGEGCVLYLAQEGRGYGLMEKVRQLSLIIEGDATTADAAGAGRSPDIRAYSDAFSILDDLLDRRGRIRLMTNNPSKLDAFESAGYTVDRIPLETIPTNANRAYLRVKKEKMGHLLTLV